MRDKVRVILENYILLKVLSIRNQGGKNLGLVKLNRIPILLDLRSKKSKKVKTKIAEISLHKMITQLLKCIKEIFSQHLNYQPKISYKLSNISLKTHHNQCLKQN